MSIDRFSRMDKPSIVLEDLVRPNDVLLGRGKRTYLHPGNQVYRREVKAKSDEYRSEGPVGKDGITRAIISLIEGNGGRFLRPGEDGRNWCQCSRDIVRSKVKQALRDAERTKSRSWFGSRELARTDLVSQTGNSTQECSGLGAADAHVSSAETYGLGEANYIQTYPGTGVPPEVEQLNWLLASPTPFPLAGLPDCGGVHLLPFHLTLQQISMAPPGSLGAVMLAPPQDFSPMQSVAEVSISRSSLEPLPFFRQEDVQQDSNVPEHSFSFSSRTGIVGGDHQDAIHFSNSEGQITGATARISNDPNAINTNFPFPY